MSRCGSIRIYSCYLLKNHNRLHVTTVEKWTKYNKINYIYIYILFLKLHKISRKNFWCPKLAASFVHVMGIKLIKHMPTFCKWYGSILFSKSYLHLYKESCRAAPGVLLHLLGDDHGLGDPGGSPPRSLDSLVPFLLGRFLTILPSQLFSEPD